LKMGQIGKIAVTGGRFARKTRKNSLAGNKVPRKAEQKRRG